MGAGAGRAGGTGPAAPTRLSARPGSDVGGAAIGSTPVVALVGVGVVRDGRSLLDGVDWQVGAGERWAVLGPNGSGKTTLLKVAAMQLLPTCGDVEVLGERYGRCDARAVRRRIAFVSAAVSRSLRATLPAHDVVLTGRFGALEPWWHEYGAADHERAGELLAAGRVGARSAQAFGLLSEGERQQVLLARALMGRPELVLLDEPAAGLDLGAREQMLARLAELAASRAAPPMVLVTHHLEEIPPGTTHAALVRDGRLMVQGPVDDILCSDAVSACFGVNVIVERTGRRWYALGAG